MSSLPENTTSSLLKNGANVEVFYPVENLAFIGKADGVLIDSLLHFTITPSFGKNLVVFFV